LVLIGIIFKQIVLYVCVCVCSLNLKIQNAITALNFSLLLIFSYKPFCRDVVALDSRAPLTILLICDLKRYDIQN
jgi:hypothetical protein